MSWIPDLAHCTYFPRPTEKLIAAGWLESGHEYPTGELRDEVFFQLMVLLVAPWQPEIRPGLHNCTLCPDHYDQLRTFARNFSFQHYFVQMGCQNLFIPGDGVIWASPSLILHYILKHHYVPPQPFQEAVLACPPMWSRQYFRAMDDIAGKYWWAFGLVDQLGFSDFEKRFDEKVESRAGWAGEPPGRGNAK